jgi:hypothetical protein
MRAFVLPAAVGALLGAALGCAIGPEQEPGCHDDAACGAGFTCRAGACLRTTTGHTPPGDDGGDPGDSGDVGDGGDAGDGA